MSLASKRPIQRPIKPPRAKAERPPTGRKLNTKQLGYAGECIARAAIAMRGCMCANANAEWQHMPNVDLIVAVPGEKSSINVAVKTGNLNVSKRLGDRVSILLTYLDRAMPPAGSYLNRKTGPQAKLFMLVATDGERYRIWVIPASRLDAMVTKLVEALRRRGSKTNQIWAQPVGFNTKKYPTELASPMAWRKYENAFHYFKGKEAAGPQ